MIKDNTEIAVSLGLEVELEWSPLHKKSVMKKASFKVGLVDQDDKVRVKNYEPIDISKLSDERLADVMLIEEASRRIWSDMKDPEKYYTRSAIEPPFEG